MIRSISILVFMVVVAAGCRGLPRVAAGTGTGRPTIVPW